MKPGVTIEAAEKDLLRAHEPIWQKSDKEKVVAVRAIVARGVRPRLHERRPGADRGGRAAAPRRLRQRGEPDARAALARRREMGIRLALGAGRVRIVRQLFAENVIFAIAGAAIGLALGQWAVKLPLAQVPDQLPHFASFGVDLRVVGFAILASMATVILFGWAPALHASRGDLRSAVHAATAA